MALSYCEYVASAPEDSVHKPYHDREYGFPIGDDRALFERLMLEVNQAGLSWEIILKRKDGFREAFDGWDPCTVAAYKETDIERLLADSRIIRNRKKIEAAIYNANVVLELAQDCGSFKNWLDSNHPLVLEAWARLFKKTFKFTGGEIVREFLTSTGYLPGAHDESCPVYSLVLSARPRWSE